MSEGWEGFTEPSKPSLEYNWNDNISNSNTVFSSFILDSDYGFKYFLKIVCTKITAVLLNFTWNDYNGLVWGQEAYPVANKSEYIREGYELRKSLKGLSYKKQKKELNVLQSL